MPLPPFDRIIVTGDIFRPGLTKRGEVRMSQRGNIEWLHAMLAMPLARATGRPVVLDTLARGEGARTLAAIYEAARPAVEPAALWARHFDNPAGLQAAFGDIAGNYRGALVVGYELPPVLRHLLCQAGVAYVDVEVHPVRFMPDQLFQLSSNVTAIVERALASAIPVDRMAAEIALITARSRRAGTREDAGVLLFTGQVPGDRALIRDGRHATLADFEAEFMGEAAQYPRVVAKPHPLAPLDEATTAVLRKVSGVKIVQGDIYRLFCSGLISRVITLSSSTGIEAGMFGLPARMLLHPDQASARPAFGLGLFESDFWRWILLGEGTAPKAPAIPLAADAIRWSLQKLEPVRFTRPPWEASPSHD